MRIRWPSDSKAGMKAEIENCPVSLSTAHGSCLRQVKVQHNKRK